jgi:hypothetical protein
MSGRHKNKGHHNNSKTKPPVTVDGRSLKDLLREFAKDWEGRQRELVAKHNEMAAQLAAHEHLIQNVSKFATSEFGKMQARLNVYFQSNEQALTHHDINDIAAAEILKEVFGQLTQMDLFFKKLASPQGFSLELSETDVEGIKKEATEWFDSVVQSAFKTASEKVEEQKQAAQKRIKVEVAQIAAEKEKVVAETNEAARMEAEMMKAEGQDRAIITPSGNAEQESLGLPPDVRVFGMT